MGSLEEHLRQIAGYPDMLPKNHVRYLETLRDNGFMPRVIYDIGASVLYWTREARRIWPDAKIIAFDAYAPVRFLYEEAGLAHHIGVLSDTNYRQVRFYQNDYYPAGNSYYLEIGSSPPVFTEDDYVLKWTERLDDVVAMHGFPLPDLIKIDVQGAELDVLRGAPNTLAHAQHLIVELQHTQYNRGAPQASESIPAIRALGWNCVAPLFQNNGPDGDYGFQPCPTH